MDAISQLEVQTEDENFAKLQTRYYKGTARIPFSALRFNHAERLLSQKNVTRLKQIFHIEGCHRLDAENYICAVVDPDVLNEALRRARIDGNLLCTAGEDGLFPLLEATTSVDCLHGLHRVRAAEEHLDENDKWWTVRLYCKGRIVEAFCNTQAFTDGEIFWKIRYYHNQSDSQAERKWWARLTEAKRKDLRRLLKDSRFAQAFDDLLDMPGLWRPINLGTLHRSLNLKCDEELLRYLKHVSAVWNKILGSCPKSAVDAATVSNLELRAPSVSQRDLDEISEQMDKGRIFHSIVGHELRAALMGNISTISCLIPSLRTYFENQKYLEPCCDILKRLAGPMGKRTILQRLMASYRRPPQLTVEYSERHWRLHASISPSADAEIAYRQLWLYTLRHFPNMTSTPPKKEQDQAKPDIQTPNPVLWHQLGRLAVKLGFATAYALELESRDPDEALAVRFLQQARPMSTITKETFGATVAEIARNLKRITQPPAAELLEVPAVCAGLGEPIRRRCGRPFESSQFKDRVSLFLPCVYAPSDARGYAITSYFVKRDLVHSFLGKSNTDFLSDPRNEPTNYDAEEEHHGGVAEGNDAMVALSTDQPLHGEFQRQRQKLDEDLRRERSHNHNLEVQARHLEEQLRDKEDELLRLRRAAQEQSGKVTEIDHLNHALLEKQRTEIERSNQLVDTCDQKSILLQQAIVKTNRLEAKLVSLTTLEAEKMQQLTNELEQRSGELGELREERARLDEQMRHWQEEITARDGQIDLLSSELREIKVKTDEELGHRMEEMIRRDDQIDLLSSELREIKVKTHEELGYRMEEMVRRDDQIGLLQQQLDQPTSSEEVVAANFEEAQSPVSITDVESPESQHHNILTFLDRNKPRSGDNTIKVILWQLRHPRKFSPKYLPINATVFEGLVEELRKNSFVALTQDGQRSYPLYTQSTNLIDSIRQERVFNLCSADAKKEVQDHIKIRMNGKARIRTPPQQLGRSPTQKRNVQSKDHTTRKVIGFRDESVNPESASNALVSKKRKYQETDTTVPSSQALVSRSASDDEGRGTKKLATEDMLIVRRRASSVYSVESQF